MATIDDALLRSLAPQREPGAHKGSVGGVMILAGSPQLPGASWLVSRSAGRNGAGIVYLAAPRSVIGIMASAIPEVACVPLPETESARSAQTAIERIYEKLERVNAFVVGPGLGDDESTDHLLSALFGLSCAHGASWSGFGFGAESTASESSESIFTKAESTVVVDADGLNWLAKQGDWWTHIPEHRLVLTPHPLELHRLSGIDVDEIVADPAALAEQLASKWKQTVVVKTGFTAASNGSRTVVSDLAPTSLATAGSGDCFAGAIGAFLAQGCDAMAAATLAIGVGSRAGMMLEQTYGPAGIIASDLPDAMAKSMHRLKSNNESEENNNG